MQCDSSWLAQLHAFKEREIEYVFKRVPAEAFKIGLELGAGDGFQSKLLSKYAIRLISTDLNPHRLCKPDNTKISYRICDAEHIDQYFGPNEFDLIFSSSLLEHLPNPRLTLCNMHRVLKKDGILIHIIPNTFWKFSHLIFFYPDRFLYFLKKFFSSQQWRGLLSKIFQILGLASEQIRHPWLFGGIHPLVGITDGQQNFAAEVKMMGNNPKTPRNSRGFLEKILVPSPHGAYESNLQELRMYRKDRWLTEFQKAGFRIISCIPGPVSSGYGFGFQRLALWLERNGFCSVYAYVGIKNGSAPSLAQFFSM